MPDGRLGRCRRGQLVNDSLISASAKLSGPEPSLHSIRTNLPKAGAKGFNTAQISELVADHLPRQGSHIAPTLPCLSRIGDGGTQHDGRQKTMDHRTETFSTISITI